MTRHFLQQELFMELQEIIILIIGAVGAVVSWLFNRTISAHDDDMKELKTSLLDLAEKREKDLDHIFGKLQQCVDGQMRITEEIHNLHRTMLENYVKRDDLAEATRRFEIAVQSLGRDLGDRINELKTDLREQRKTRP
jgi:hypothetical protein